MLVVVSVTILIVIPAVMLLGLLLWRVMRPTPPEAPIDASATIVQRWTIRNDTAQLGLLLEAQFDDLPYFYFTEATATVSPEELSRWLPGATVDIAVSSGNLAEINVIGLAEAQPDDRETVLRRVAERAEAMNEKTRKSGKNATGIVVGTRNTGIQIPANGFLQRLTLDVQPIVGMPFRADTILITPGTLEPRFRPGARISVRFRDSEFRHVAVDVAGALVE